jgi:hypothetical protein
MIVAAWDGDPDGVKDGFLNPARDNLGIDRDTLSAGIAASDRGEVGVGVGAGVGGGEGRPVGRKREGRRVFIATT